MTKFSFENRALGIIGNPERHAGIIAHALGTGAAKSHVQLQLPESPSSRLWDDVDYVGAQLRGGNINTVVTTLGDRIATLAVEMANLAGRPTDLLSLVGEDAPQGGQDVLPFGSERYVVTHADDILARSLNSSNFAILLGKI